MPEEPEPTPSAPPLAAAPPLAPPPARLRKSPWRWPLRLLLLAILVGGVVALRATVLKPKPLQVRVSAVTRGKVEATITNSRAGTVRARRRSKLSAETGGRVVAVHFKEGQRVEAGALLVELSDDSQRARLLAAQQALHVAQAQRNEAHVRATRAKRELKRNTALAETRIITPDQLDSLASAAEAAQAGFESARARVSQATAEVAVAEVELRKCRVVAPFGGVLAEVSVEVGEWVTPAPTGIVVPGVIDLIDTRSIYVSAPMDEVDSAVIATGQPARVSLDPYPGQTFPAKVSRVAAYVLDVEAQNRTVEVEVELEDSAHAAKLLCGTSADVEVILKVRPDTLRIPAAALVEGERVYCVSDGHIVERQVEVGLKNWDWIEVTSGLKEGEEVVTNLGLVGLGPGAAVEVLK
ncbi:MAG TPA: efflux RND transporter periplasmic adaptor subunit [Planctomycetes bacterium]|nr:efflux RND transporter periplasmic adaptor subunit [Planctomycetota bacterium]